MIVLKSAREIETMRVGGSILAVILDELCQMIRPGISLSAMNRHSELLCRKYRVVPAFKGYHGFPASLCTSVNEEVVHGIPNNRTLKKGDIVGMDFGVLYQNLYVDSAVTVAVGETSPQIQDLMRVTKEALYKGIEQARPGNRLFDISGAIQKHVESYGFSVVRDFVGHGIGRSMHEPPQVPNYVSDDFNPKLKAGMTLAIEPMVNAGTYEVEVDPHDHWTVRTGDRQFSAHYEHTIVITTGEPEILTLLRPEILPKVE